MSWFWEKEKEQAPQVEANYVVSNPIVVQSFDGEKNPGEIGLAKNYKSDFKVLSVRSWQSYFESEVTQTIINKYSLWMVGSGLKLQSLPITNVIEANGFSIDKNSYTKNIETFFKLFVDSERSDYSGKQSLNKRAETVFKNSRISGDVLVILRFDGKQMTVQMIDSSHVRTPFGYDRKSELKGKNIVDGVELNLKGGVEAYHLLKKDGTFDRIEAKDSKGRKVAFLVFGKQYRENDTRGMSDISVMLETIAKLDRYKEATVAGAEERQKVAYTIEHDSTSTGENPMTRQISSSINGGNSSCEVDSFDSCETLKQDIAFTSEKDVYNMPVGAKMKSLESKSELYFKDFYDTNFQHACAAIGIPPDVAMSLYNSSYSASRAAIKDWEHILKVGRKEFADQFYKPVFSYWLDVMVLSGKIKIPGYLEALENDNFDLLDSYKHARFIGANVPHIDPLKEVKAERAKLGNLSPNVPLTTVEAAIERLDGGDFENISEQFQDEIKGYEEEEEITE